MGVSPALFCKEGKRRLACPQGEGKGNRIDPPGWGERPVVGTRKAGGLCFERRDRKKRGIADNIARNYVRQRKRNANHKPWGGRGRRAMLRAL